MNYEEIKKAVFYAHEKPDLLAKIIFDITNANSSSGGDSDDNKDNGGE